MSFFRKIFGGGEPPRTQPQRPSAAITDPSFWEKPVPVSPEHEIVFTPEDESAIDEDYALDEGAAYDDDEYDEDDFEDDEVDDDVERTDSGSIIVVQESKLEPFDAAFVKALRVPATLSVEHMVKGYAAWLEINTPALHATLNPGATDAQLDAFEAATGATLPVQVRELYRCFNGGSPENGLFDFDFNDLDAMAREYTSAQDRVSEPALAVLSDGEENFIVVALEGTHTGAVYDIHVDSGERHLLACSLQDFIRQYLLQVAFGNYTLEASAEAVLISLGTEDQEFNELFEPGAYAETDDA